jgi:hypothetical protein
VTLYLNGVPPQAMPGPLNVTIGAQAAAVAATVPDAASPGVTAIAVQVPFGPTAVTTAPVGVQWGPYASPSGVTLTVGGN